MSATNNGAAVGKNLLPANYNAIVGERLRSVREEHGMSMTAVGDILGVTHASISRYEAGVISPRKSVVEKFAKHFKVDILWLIGLSDEKYTVAAHEGVCIPIFRSIKKDVPVLAQTDIATYYWVSTDAGVAYGMLMRETSC